MDFDKGKALFSNYGVRLWKWFLQKLFHFDRWHIVSLRQRKYAQDIIRFCNEKKIRNSFVEIGCGLGDIIRNVHYNDKYGYDVDQKVLNAASFLSKISLRGKAKFATFHFPETPLAGKHDVIVMVNWIHHIPPEILKRKLEEYCNESVMEGGMIIIDTVQDKEYKFNHSVEFLAGGPGMFYTKLGDYERMRQIWILQSESK
jgi:2-polyprenyl-3-methyl-5-hydroxy-6-metoxy-1,4-benzoquinol methylase